jgi:hypothetical protein
VVELGGVDDEGVRVALDGFLDSLNYGCSLVREVRPFARLARLERRRWIGPNRHERRRRARLMGWMPSRRSVPRKGSVSAEQPRPGTAKIAGDRA